VQSHDEVNTASVDHSGGLGVLEEDRAPAIIFEKNIYNKWAFEQVIEVCVSETTFCCTWNFMMVKSYSLEEEIHSDERGYIEEDHHDYREGSNIYNSFPNSCKDFADRFPVSKQLE